MNFFEGHPLASLTFGGPLLLISGLLLAAVFRRFITSPLWPSYKLVVMACWSFLGTTAGFSTAIALMNLFARGWFDDLHALLPAGWGEFQSMASIVAVVWMGCACGAWVGHHFWRRGLPRAR